MRIVDKNAQAQCSATSYGGYGAAASAPRECRKPARSLQQRDAAPVDEQTALTSSLYDLTAARKGTEPVHFTREDIERFAELKRRLCAAPRLAHPNLEAPFTVYTDASNIALYAVILQRDTGGVERVIYFFSTKLSSAQRNYSTLEREILAVVCALEHFKVYLLARSFRLRTDHRAL